MDDLLEIIDYVKRAGARFADIREQSVRNRYVVTKDARAEHLVDETNAGTGIRILYGNGWGYAATKNKTPEGLKKAADKALELARLASPLANEPIILASEPKHIAKFSTKAVKDVETVPLEEPLERMIAAGEKILKQKDMIMAKGFLHMRKQKRRYANTEGSRIETELQTVMPEITAMARANGEVKTRSFALGGENAGYEYFADMPIEDNLERICSEAREHCYAKQCAEGPTTLVLDPRNLSLTMHESVGHPTELDRVLGYEESNAGRSFATLEKLHTFRYGSELVNFVADNTWEGGLASYGYDDEGVECQKWLMVKDGILNGYGACRELAHKIGLERANGTTRATEYYDVPITRIPNLYLAPGKKPLTKEEIIADTKDGIYIEGRGTFSIDQMRLNMQFGGDAFWQIKNGKITGMLKDVVYNAISYQFWRSCDAIADEREFERHGFTTCGKGDPSQIGQMSHGASPSRFRNIMVRRAK